MKRQNSGKGETKLHSALIFLGAILLVLTCSVVAVTKGGEYPTDPCLIAAVEAGMSEELADVLTTNPAHMLAAERALLRELATDLGVAEQCADRLN